MQWLAWWWPVVIALAMVVILTWIVSQDEYFRGIEPDEGNSLADIEARLEIERRQSVLYDGRHGGVAPRAHAPRPMIGTRKPSHRGRRR